ncbi:MAG: hypothetical protein PVJ64_13235 [Gemmatimonadales bacterium]|jgi:hypothetical protein
MTLEADGAANRRAVPEIHGGDQQRTHRHTDKVDEVDRATSIAAGDARPVGVLRTATASIGSPLSASNTRPVTVA